MLKTKEPSARVGERKRKEVMVMHLHTPLEDLVEAALTEDIGQRDITTEACVPPDARCRARLIAKQDGILSGIEPFHMAFYLMDADISDWESMEDGTPVSNGDTVAAFIAHTRAVLTAERTAMNFAQHLSGVATMTSEYVRELDGIPCRVCNTRKTTPMLRELEKKAVVDGGGADHRFNLFNGILIKENHITAAGSVEKAIRKSSHSTHHLHRVAVEVTNLDEFDEALAAGADVIMLDNMNYDDMREAVRRAEGQRVVLEASGNATLERLRQMAETGVDFISVGALTHSAPVLDMSLLIEKR
jgi:nicotinate-nucleotide pyrophosphorylase (carboxylating)